MQNLVTENDSFFREYTSADAISKYTRATAGYGISYLLDHDYKDVYLQALGQLPAEVKQRGIRILEFGCGGGMNLIHLVPLLERHGIRVEKAFGTDFSPVLVDAARRESRKYLAPQHQGRVEFHVGKNETLVADLTAATGQSPDGLDGSFHFILGVNTFRYCHRAGKELDCARDILRLLAPGGICVNIDMNRGFPAFRSSLRALLADPRPENEAYLPSLEEHTAPFAEAGFEVLRSKAFCWVPHSAGPVLCALCRVMAPVLDAVAGSRAMRTLVVSRKPASR